MKDENISSNTPPSGDTKNKDVRDTEAPKWKWGKKDLRPKFIKMNKHKSPKKKH